MSIFIQGTVASNGYALAEAMIYRGIEFELQAHEIKDTPTELHRLDEAIATSIQQVTALRNQTLESLGSQEADIFEAHIYLLQDPEFIGAIKNLIETQHVHAEFCVSKVTLQYMQLFEGMIDDYMKQRGSDLRDIGQRIIANLRKEPYGLTSLLQIPIILVARELSPSDTIRLDLRHVKGFITEEGGQTSHSAIMARSRGIPAVVGLSNLLENIHEGDLLLLDGVAGTVMINPTYEEQNDFEQRVRDFENERVGLMELKNMSSTTSDKHSIELAANISGLADLPSVIEQGAEGIGLFRTEFLFMNRTSLPDEEEQFEVYRQVAERMTGRPIIIRTFDIGGDKQLDYLDLPYEDNPFLGYRAIRISLDRPELFKTQLRAILRASHYGNIRIMYPMIATVEEVRLANQMCAEVKQDLIQQGIPFHPQIEVGIMIEIPAAALLANQLAKEVDFFSLGTNDLIQYMMACDRMNPHVSNLYQPFHPSILTIIKQVIEAAHQSGKWVGVCGEMASDPLAAQLLIGMGIDELSMNASQILPIRRMIRTTSFTQLQQIVKTSLSYATSDEVKAHLHAEFAKLQKNVN